MIQGYGIPPPPSIQPHTVQLSLHSTTPDPYPNPESIKSPTTPLTLHCIASITLEKVIEKVIPEI